jgi:hypothetical protein
MITDPFFVVSSKILQCTRFKKYWRTLSQYISMLVSLSPKWPIHLIKLVISYYYFWVNVVMLKMSEDWLKVSKNITTYLCKMWISTNALFSAIPPFTILRLSQEDALRLIHTYHGIPMPFPCHAIPVRIQIVSFPFHLHSAAMFDSHMLSCSHVPFPWHAMTMLFWKWPLKAATQRGTGKAWYVWISNGWLDMECGWPAHIRLLPATMQSSKVVTRSRLTVRIFLSTTRTFTKDKALLENGRVVAWHVWINTAWERQGMRELAFKNTWNVTPSTFQPQIIIL